RNQERLLHELQHRVKNILATVTALTSRMVRSSGTLNDFASAFHARLQAMARTHELLASYQWGGADLEKLVRATLSPYGGKEGQSLVVQGEPFQLNASAAATLGLVFFELASNAAKYGALATEKGRVEVSWRVDGSQMLSIAWKESGGPRVKEPSKTSFGTTFIQQSLEYELGGNVDLRFKRAGLECLLSIPLPKSAMIDYLSLPAPGKV
ncbi:sensor histidine kinase, partial [Mesorhizobium sp. M4B.F.Ca.ET.019.03.1.1]